MTPCALCGLGFPPSPQSLGSDWAGRTVWELGKTILPVSKFHKAHGGNFVVSFLVEVVDFITMWFYFHCTHCCVPPCPSPRTLCALLSLDTELWICPTDQYFAVLWARRGSKQATPSPACSVPCPGNTCCSKVSLCWDFSVGGVIKSMVCSSTKRHVFWPWFKQAFKHTVFSDLSEHAELLISTWFPGGSHSALRGWLSTKLSFAVEAVNTEVLCSSRCNQCVFSLADSPADTVFVYSQRTHEEDFRDTHVCHWG